MHVYIRSFAFFHLTWECRNRIDMSNGMLRNIVGHSYGEVLHRGRPPLPPGRINKMCLALDILNVYARPFSVGICVHGRFGKAIVLRKYVCWSSFFGITAPAMFTFVESINANPYYVYMYTRSFTFAGAEFEGLKGRMPPKVVREVFM